LTRKIAGFGGDGPDDAWIARHQNWCEDRHFQIAVVPSGYNFFVGAIKICFKTFDRLMVIPRMWKRSGFAAKLEERHARGLAITIKKD
jgi:hypothetical protein